MIPPEMTKMTGWVDTAPFRLPIIVLTSPEPPLHITFSYESTPATKTPIKFTKSLPAKAKANERVPASTVIFRILILHMAKIAMIMLQPTNKISSSVKICVSIQAITSRSFSDEPFNPLKMAK